MIPDERSEPMNDVQIQNQKLDKTPYPFCVEDLFAQEGAPRLENGDHLTRAEFERRYDAMPIGSMKRMSRSLTRCSGCLPNYMLGTPRSGLRRRVSTASGSERPLAKAPLA